MMALMAGNYAHSQMHDPCLKTLVHLYGDTIVRYYPVIKLSYRTVVTPGEG